MENNAAFEGVFGTVFAGWTNIILCKPASLAVIVSAFAEYTTAPFYPGCDPPNDLKRLVAICALLFISIVNGLSVKASERMQIVFTVAKLSLIAAIIIGGFVYMGQGNTENFQNAFEGTSRFLVQKIRRNFFSKLKS